MVEKISVEKISRPVRIVVMHQGPHPDEIAALLLLRRFGEELFPGIKNAQMVFWPYSGQTPDGASAETWLVEKQVLLLGQGYGMFDEHPCPEQNIPRKAGYSTTSLVAAYLGLKPRSPEGRAVAWLAKEITAVDLNGGSGALSIEAVMTAMYRGGRSSSEMLDFGIAMLTALLEDQIEFQRTYGSGCRAISYRRCGRYTLASTFLPSEHILKVARLRGGHLLVKRDPYSKHVTIMSNHESGLPLDDLVAELRQLENGGLFPEGISPSAEGSLRGWFFQPKIGLITTGGGRGSKGNNLSSLPWSVIFEVIVNWLTRQSVAPVNSNGKPMSVASQA